MLDHSFLFLLVGGGCSPRCDAYVIICFMHKPLLLGRRKSRTAFLCTPCTDIGAVLVYQHGDKPSRLLPVSFTGCLFKMESMRQDSHFVLVLAVFLEELCLVKKPCSRNSFGARWGLVNSRGFIEWEGIPAKKPQWIPQQSWMDFVQTWFVGPLEQKAELKGGHKAHDAPVVSASPGQSSEWREEGRAGESWG